MWHLYSRHRHRHRPLTVWQLARQGIVLSGVVIMGLAMATGTGAALVIWIAKVDAGTLAEAAALVIRR